MRRRTRRKYATIIFTVGALTLMVVMLFRFFHEEGGSFETNIQDTVVYDGEEYKKKDLLNFLVMGIDKETETEESEFYYNDGRADFLALVSVDVFAKCYTILHINRDTMADVEALLSQFAEKCTAEEELLIPLFGKLEDYMVTNCSVNTFRRLLGYMADYHCESNVTLEGEAKKGKRYMEYYVDEEKKTQLIMDWFYKKLGT